MSISPHPLRIALYSACGSPKVLTISRSAYAWNSAPAWACTAWSGLGKGSGIAGIVEPPHADAPSAAAPSPRVSTDESACRRRGRHVGAARGREAFVGDAEQLLPRGEGRALDGRLEGEELVADMLFAEDDLRARDLR